MCLIACVGDISSLRLCVCSKYMPVFIFETHAAFHLVRSPFCSRETWQTQSIHCCCLYHFLIFLRQQTHASLFDLDFVLSCVTQVKVTYKDRDVLTKEGELFLFSLNSTFLSFVSQHVSYHPFLCTNCRGKEEDGEG